MVDGYVYIYIYMESILYSLLDPSKLLALVTVRSTGFY